MKNSGIGGQAVMEGVMMKNADVYAVAVRKPNKEIEVQKQAYKSVLKSNSLRTIPIIRGVINFVDSLVLGMKVLTFSASFLEEETEEELTEEKKKKQEQQDKIFMGVAVAFSIIMAIGIFMILPFFIAGFLRKLTESSLLIAAAEGVIRILIFLLYIWLISNMQDIKRVYMYHGAEHKCINCIEHGLPLTVENARNSSRLHRRCGTSFLLIVMVVSIILFMFIRVEDPMLRVVIRIILVPLIAGISYEFIRLAGRSENALVAALSKPGMMLQKMTTKEPTDDMLEVAITSVEAVFDWKQFLDS